MPTLSVRADIVVQSADGGIVALVEVRNREALTAEVAAAIRRNLFVHGLVGRWSPFFLLVSQDQGFLWDQRSTETTDDSPPTVEFSMSPVVERYLPSLAHGDRLTGSQLELGVAQWLSDLAAIGESGTTAPEHALAQTDFLRLIKGGRVGAEVEL